MIQTRHSSSPKELARGVPKRAFGPGHEQVFFADFRLRPSLEMTIYASRAVQGVDFRVPPPSLGAWPTDSNSPPRRGTGTKPGGVARWK
jgi:hypothetical protein